MDGRRRRRRAAVLGIIAALVWFVEWVPALLVAAFVTWAVLHTRMEGAGGDGLRRGWRRVWPPATLVLVPLLLIAVGGTWTSARPVEAKVVPIALEVLALAVIAGGMGRGARDPIAASPPRWLARPSSRSS